MELMSPVEVISRPKRHEGMVAAGKPDPAYRAYEMLYLLYFILPIAAGLDKFFNILTDWNKYLAPAFAQLINWHTPALMKAIGIVEIVAGCWVAVKPRWGALVVALWLWCVTFNLLLSPGYWDIAVRDFALSLGALSLWHLSKEFGTAG